MRCNTDPFYTANTEDQQALLHPLLATSWLIDDFFADDDYFGITAQADLLGRKALMLLSSAFSKTAYGTAFQMAQRCGIEVVGLTSSRNVAFCKSLGCYHRILTYEQLEPLALDTPPAYIDFAGNAALRKALHTHCTALVVSSSIGGSHVSELGSGRDTPDPKPTLFFAPAQIKKRSAEWGAAVLSQRLAQSWQQLTTTVSNPDHPWLQMHHHQGEQAVEPVDQQELSGQDDARWGHVLFL